MLHLQRKVNVADWNVWDVWFRPVRPSLTPSRLKFPATSCPGGGADSFTCITQQRLLINLCWLQMPPACHHRRSQHNLHSTSLSCSVKVKWSNYFSILLRLLIFSPLLCKAKSRQNGLALRLSPRIHGRVIPAADEGDTLPARMELL